MLGRYCRRSRLAGRGSLRYFRAGALPENGSLSLCDVQLLWQKAVFADGVRSDLWERSLETMRVRYGFAVAGYGLMPEHVPLLVSEPKQVLLATAIQALKLSVSVQSVQRPFWLTRYYDFHVFSAGKRQEKVEYMHRNPVARGLVGEPGEWVWSSYRHYQTGERGVVEIESEWTPGRRERVSKSKGVGAPCLDFETWVGGGGEGSCGGYG